MSRLRSFTNEENVLFLILARALFPAQFVLPSFPENVDWLSVLREARHQTVLPLVAEGMALLPPEQRPPAEIMDAARQGAFSSVIHHERMMRAQDVLLSILQDASIPCVILKGSSAAALYPKPELRVLGDIDVLVTHGDTEAARTLLAKNGYREKEKPELQHIVFLGHGAEVELHYEMTIYPDSQVGRELQAHLRNAVDNSVWRSMDKHTFPALGPADQALSLLLHMERHLLESGLGLRQLCDWAVYVYRTGEDLWEREIAPLLRTFGLYRFAAIVTKACVLGLGLPRTACPWSEAAATDLSHAFLIDLLEGGNFGRKDPTRQADLLMAAPAEGKPVRISVVTKINYKARLHFPVCQRHPILLPLAWIGLPIRYYLGRRKGKYSRKTVNFTTIKGARERASIYRQFHLFEPDSKA